MIYNVFGGTLNFAQSINLFSHTDNRPAPLWRSCDSGAIYRCHDLTYALTQTSWN